MLQRRPCADSWRISRTAKCTKAINWFVDGLCKSSKYPATGHYELSFTTTSEIEMSTATVAEFRPPRSEFAGVRVAAKVIACFVEIVTLFDLCAAGQIHPPGRNTCKPLSLAI